MNITQLPSKATGFQTFEPYEYIKIDAANQFGLDKENFETRINWFDENESQLQNLVKSAPDKERPLFQRAVLAWKEYKEGKPSGYMVGLDACSSGPQIMSAMMGCAIGAENTGLIDPTQRKDLYSIGTATMETLLGAKVNISRKDMKYCLMPYYYGSLGEPRRIFGEGTPEVAAFFEAMALVCPGANSLRNDLIAAWQGTSEHSFTMPDGFKAKLKNYEKVTYEITVTDLPIDVSFVHNVVRNAPSEFGVALAAHAVHGTDGFVVKELNRRCNYPKEEIAERLIELAMVYEADYVLTENDHRDFLATNVAMEKDVYSMSMGDVHRAVNRLKLMQSHKPFPIIPVHDEFKCHPNNMNRLRYWYKEVLAEIAESYLIEDILREITGNKRLTLVKESVGLGDKIRNSNYAIS